MSNAEICQYAAPPAWPHTSLQLLSYTPPPPRPHPGQPIESSHHESEINPGTKKKIHTLQHSPFGSNGSAAPARRTKICFAKLLLGPAGLLAPYVWLSSNLGSRDGPQTRSCISQPFKAQPQKKKNKKESKQSLKVANISQR